MTADFQESGMWNLFAGMRYIAQAYVQSFDKDAIHRVRMRSINIKTGSFDKP